MADLKKSQKPKPFGLETLRTGKKEDTKRRIKFNRKIEGVYRNMNAVVTMLKKKIKARK